MRDELGPGFKVKDVKDFKKMQNCEGKWLLGEFRGAWHRLKSTVFLA
jgi:hypothetical protein